MRLAYLISEYPAPSHTFIRREISALRDRGVFIKIFGIRKPADASIYSQQDALSRDETYYVLPLKWLRLLESHLRSVVRHPGRYIKVLRLATRHRVSGMKALVWSLYHFVEAIQIAYELKAARIDHLHSHFANSGATVGLLATRFAGIGWSLTLHGISETDFPAGVLLGQKVELAKFVACASYFIRAQAMRVVASAYWEKMIIVRCGIDLSVLPEATKQKDNACPTIVAVGRLSPEKGFHGLLKAFAQMQARGVKAKLRIIGAGSLKAQLEQEISLLQIDKAVVLTGGMSEKETLQEIANSDLLSLPSLMEGLPVVLMEALALGVPVVASHIAGIPELVIEGQTGLLFRPTDWEDLRTKLEMLLQDLQLREDLGRQGRHAIEAEYTIQHSAEVMQRYLKAM